MSTLRRYNIALLPTDLALQVQITDISRYYFLDLQDEYILGPEGLAHITLCQFKTDDLTRAINVYHDILAEEIKGPLTLTIEQFRVRPGTLVNNGKFIAEYIIRPQPYLMETQFKCAEKLAAYNLTSLTPSNTYSPHITLARLSDVPDHVPSDHDLDCPLEIATRAALGVSTETGVFVKDLNID